MEDQTDEFESNYNAPTDLTRKNYAFKADVNLRLVSRCEGRLRPAYEHANDNLARYRSWGREPFPNMQTSTPQNIELTKQTQLDLGDQACRRFTHNTGHDLAQPGRTSPDAADRGYRELLNSIAPVLENFYNLNIDSRRAIRLRLRIQF
jgi:hypothetical protein